MTHDPFAPVKIPNVKGWPEIPERGKGFRSFVDPDRGWGEHQVVYVYYDANNKWKSHWARNYPDIAKWYRTQANPTYLWRGFGMEILFVWGAPPADQVRPR